MNPVEKARLTPREAEVLSLVALGLSNTVICSRLYVETNTVKTHLRRIRAKLGVRARPELVTIAYRRRIVPLPPRPDGQPPHIADRQLRALCLLSSGEELSAVAKALTITHSTARAYVRDTRRVLGARTQAHAVSLLYRWRILPLGPVPDGSRPSGCPTTAPTGEDARAVSRTSGDGGCSCATAAAPPTDSPVCSSHTGQFTRRTAREPVL